MKSPSSLKTEFSWILSGNLFYAAMQYFMLIGMVKLTTPLLVGQFSFGLAVNAPIALFMSMAIRAVVVSDANGRFAKKTYLKLRLLTAVATVLAALIFILVSRQSGQLARIILLIAFIKGFESISDVIYGFMQKFNHTHQIAKSLMARGMLSLTLTGVCFYWGRSIEWVCVGWLLATVIVLLVYDLPRIPKVAPAAATAVQTNQQPNNMKALFFLALPLGIATVLSSLESNAPRYFIEGALGLSSLGIFSALSYPLMLTNQIVGSLAIAPAPRLALYFHGQNYLEFNALLHRLVLMAASLSAASSVICFLVGKPLLMILNGPAYALENHTFVVLSLATGFSSVAIFYGAALNAMQCFYTKLILQLTSLATVVAAAAIAASQKTLLAMSLALLMGGVVSLITQFMAFKIQYHRHLKRPPLERN